MRQPQEAGDGCQGPEGAAPAGPLRDCLPTDAGRSLGCPGNAGFPWGWGSGGAGILASQHRPLEGLIDASLLDDVELIPTFSHRASMVLDDGGTSDSGASAAGASPDSDRCASGRRAAHGAGHAAGALGGFGSDLLIELSLAKLAAGMPQVRLDACGAGRNGSPSARREATYQEQQALLRTQAAAAAAGAEAAKQLEQQRQDTWLVFVIAELLGSYAIGPPSMQQAAAAGSPIGASAPCQTGGGYRGYGSGTVSVDLMSARVTYPQFLEVLLVCAAARCTALIDMGLPGLAPLEDGGEFLVRGAGAGAALAAEASVWPEMSACSAMAQQGRGHVGCAAPCILQASPVAPSVLTAPIVAAALPLFIHTPGSH
jgi:hypothetical protein